MLPPTAAKRVIDAITGVGTLSLNDTHHVLQECNMMEVGILPNVCIGSTEQWAAFDFGPIYTRISRRNHIELTSASA